MIYSALFALEVKEKEISHVRQHSTEEEGLSWNWKRHLLSLSPDRPEGETHVVAVG